MKNIYPVSISKIEKPAHFDKLLSALNRGFEKYEVDYVIIGAFVRDIWLQYIHKESESRRATKDIDFALEMTNIEQYEQLVKHLIDNEGFISANNKFNLVSPQGIEIDLCPFGEIEKKPEYEKWVVGEKNFRKPSTIGLQESFIQKIVIETENNPSFKIITLENLICLKIIAWNDRPEVREKDAKDLTFILDKYYDIHSSDIFDNHWDLLTEYEAQDLPWKCGARLMGRKIQESLLDYNGLKLCIIQIIENQLNRPENCKLALAMCENNEQYEQKLESIKLIFQGLKEELKN